MEDEIMICKNCHHLKLQPLDGFIGRCGTDINQKMVREDDACDEWIYKLQYSCSTCDNTVYSTGHHAYVCNLCDDIYETVLLDDPCRRWERNGIKYEDLWSKDQQSRDTIKTKNSKEE